MPIIGGSPAIKTSSIDRAALKIGHTGARATRSEELPAGLAALLAED